MADIGGDADDGGLCIDVERAGDLVTKGDLDPFGRQHCDGGDRRGGVISKPPMDASNALSGLTSSLSF
ncbi:MAG: hypothetical protein ROR55_09725 [Devosia sp.]